MGRLSCFTPLSVGASERFVFYIPIILGSTRRGRQSAKVARFVHGQLAAKPGVETELLDLLEFSFPIMEERLRMRDDPPPESSPYA